MISILFMSRRQSVPDIGSFFRKDPGAFHVDTVTSADEAIEMFSWREYDAIVFDHLPDISDIEFIQDTGLLKKNLPFILFISPRLFASNIEACRRPASLHFRERCPTRENCLELLQRIAGMVNLKPISATTPQDVIDYRNIVDSQTEFICRFRPDGTHVFANDAYCKYFGWEYPNLIGKIFRPCIPEGDRTRVREHFSSLSISNPIATIDHRIIMPDGSISWQRWTDRALYDNSTTLVGYQSVGRDISDLVHSADTLGTACKKQHLMSAMTRHDISNILLALRAYLELSREKITDPELLSLINKAYATAGRIDEHIAFTRLYEDIGMNSSRWQNVGSTIRSAISRLGPHQVRISADLDDYDIFADPLLDRVFYNLVDNAFRYGEKKISHITFSMRENSEFLILVCEDDGIGIPPDQKTNIFTRNYFRHTGYGLFLSREILSITGMTITETGTEGVGARFEIAIPKEAKRFSGHP